MESMLETIATRLKDVENTWATCTKVGSPVSLGEVLENAAYALKSMPMEAAPVVVLFTDGVCAFEHTYDDMLMQYSRHKIACHIVQLGSKDQPHTSFGYVPDAQLLRFVAIRTKGSYSTLQDMNSIQIEKRSQKLQALTVGLWKEHLQEYKLATTLAHICRARQSEVRPKE